MTGSIQLSHKVSWRQRQRVASLPFRNQIVHITPAHKLFPRTGLPGGGRAAGAQERQVQALRELPERGGELAVVDGTVLVRVELVEQSLDLGVRDAELPAHRDEVLVLDPARFVHVTGGKEPPETRRLHRGMD